MLMESSPEKILNFVKGRIGEFFTENILRESDYIVLPYGYEHHFGELIDRVLTNERIKQIVTITRMTPDFIVLSKRKESNCFFIDAKFRTKLDIEKFIEEEVIPVDKFWKQVHFFVITSKPPYFYYDFVNTIIKTRKIRTLKEWGPKIGVSKGVIEKYEKIAEDIFKKF